MDDRFFERDASYRFGEVLPNDCVKHEIDKGAEPDEVTTIYDNTAIEISLGNMMDAAGKVDVE